MKEAGVRQLNAGIIWNAVGREHIVTRIKRKENHTMQVSSTELSALLLHWDITRSSSELSSSRNILLFGIVSSVAALFQFII